MSHGREVRSNTPEGSEPKQSGGLVRQMVEEDRRVGEGEQM